MNRFILLACACSFVFVLSIPTLHAQQWLGSSTSAEAIYRQGAVGIGLTPVESRLHIFSNNIVKEPLPGTEPPKPNSNFAHVRLEEYIDPSQGDGVLEKHAVWDWHINGNSMYYNYTNPLAPTPSTVQVFQTSTNSGSFYGSYISLGNSTYDNYSRFGRFSGLNQGYGAIFGGRQNSLYYEFAEGGSMLFTDKEGNFSVVTATPGSIFQPDLDDYRYLTVSNAGNVGVGTITPSHLLTVAHKDHPVLFFDNDATDDWELLSNPDGSFNFNGGPSLQEFMRITSKGKVAIGTDNTPENLDGGSIDIAGYKLFVEGGILTDELRIRTGWADYVFEADYERRPLKEVGAYIREHGHLPGIPSGTAMEENGVAIGQATRLQQEKIEELFLYLIEMDQEIQLLKAENETLKARLEAAQH